MTNTRIIRWFLPFLLTILLAVAAEAQSDASQYVISAKAGGINFTSGDVKITRKAASQPVVVSTLDSAESGDQIETGSNSRVEILLNPGSYLRLGENSILDVTDTSFDSLRFNLRSGQAIFEITGDEDEIAPVGLTVAQGVVSLDKEGIYRVQYREPETATIRVQKGRARMGDEKFGDGKEIVVDRGRQIDVVKFDKKEQDDFALWSSERAKSITEANEKLSKDTVSRLSSGFRSGSMGRRRGFNGYWLYDPFYARRTFLPFYSSWSSPYGHHYRRHFGFSHSGFGLFRRPSTRTSIRIFRPSIIRHPVKHGGGRRH
ncbi:MAG TPA: FecR domain-containing protein [Pyrinomonadaceae bacterium]|jgi:hypothetical protein|nr:FecR domain-containing protein [Acidobacteriota bacterium]HMT07914.1 FecR domain-containing protein [Pyrinomonadaceae bacterium]